MHTSFSLNFAHPSHDYNSELQALLLFTLANRRYSVNLAFLNNPLNNNIESPKLPSHINFKVPCRSTCFFTHFVILITISNLSNNYPVSYAYCDPFFGVIFSPCTLITMLQYTTYNIELVLFFWKLINK